MQMEQLPESPTRDNAESSLNVLRTKRLESYKQQLGSQIAEAASRNDRAMVNQLHQQRRIVDRELVSLSRK
jgi:hypothetical protein